MAGTYITVIGNIFVDIKGQALRPLHKDAKNVGNVQIVHGGVGRNIAHNLGVLQAPVRFVSSVTQGGLGNEVVSVLNGVGVDTTYVRPFSESGMGLWLAVLQPDGDLAVSISAQPTREYQEDAILSNLDEYLADARIVGLDVGITDEVTKRVKAACKERGIPLYAVVGNLDVVEQHPETLRGFDVFVCNEEEAEILAKQPVDTPAEAKSAAVKILAHGCKACVITLAEHGCVIATADSVHHVPAEPVELVDSTGAGDAFFTGLLYGAARGDNLLIAAHFASAVAAKVVSTSENTLATRHGLV